MLDKESATRLLDGLRDKTHTYVWPELEELGDYLTHLESANGKLRLGIRAVVEELKRISEAP